MIWGTLSNTKHNFHRIIYIKLIHRYNKKVNLISRPHIYNQWSRNQTSESTQPRVTSFFLLSLLCHDQVSSNFYRVLSYFIHKIMLSRPYLMGSVSGELRLCNFLKPYLLYWQMITSQPKPFWMKSRALFFESENGFGLSDNHPKSQGRVLLLLRSG